MIHTDFQRGFIERRGRLVRRPHVRRLHQAKEAGRVRMEGKDYCDGDVVEFRFNV